MLQVGTRFCGETVFSFLTFFSRRKGGDDFFEKKISEANNNTKSQRINIFPLKEKVKGQNVIYVGSSESGAFIGVVFESPELTNRGSIDE